MNENDLHPSDAPSCTATSAQCYTKLLKEHEDTKHVHPVLYLNEIPGAMDKMGWKVSAKMMRHWFDNHYWKMPPRDRGGLHNENPDDPVIYSELDPWKVNEDIITMKWARGFYRFEVIFEKLRLRWDTLNSRRLLRKRLLHTGWRPGVCFKLGMVGQKASVLENISQINFRPFGNYRDTLDDFYGAIFKATLHVAVVGYTTLDPLSNKDIFVVTDLGYYIRDTYDFNDGDKLSDLWVNFLTGGLGIWSRDKMLSKWDTVMHYDNNLKAALAHPNIYKGFWKEYGNFVPVSNGDFYKWADKYNKGGDFYVFSDVLWEKPYGGRCALELPVE